MATIHGLIFNVEKVGVVVSDIVAVMKVIAPLEGALSFLVMIVIIGIFMYQEEHRRDLESVQRKADNLASEKKDAQILELFNRVADQSAEKSECHTKILNAITEILVELSKREELKNDQMKRLLDNQNINDQEFRDNLYQSNLKLVEIGKKMESVATKGDVDTLALNVKGWIGSVLQGNKVF